MTRFVLFQLTRSRGAWLALTFGRIQARTISTHTLTWSVTCDWTCSLLLCVNFNSHAHVERDPDRQGCLNYWQISTHTLTWSVTPTATIPTTAIRWFQLTRSRGAWRNTLDVLCDTANFNSHAHVERDSANKSTLDYERAFQLTRSRGAWPAEMICTPQACEFQLTRSRGAWLTFLLLYVIINNFNSHAHVERDFVNQQLRLLYRISTHTLTWSVTCNIKQ